MIVPGQATAARPPGRRLRWWYWLVTAGLLGTSLAGWRAGLWVTMACVAVQAVHYAAREGSLRAFPVQNRIAYLALLAVGSWPPLGFIHWLQLAGTCASVGVDYCPLARIISLMPWNRTQPLTLRRVWRTFASPPVAGSILFGRPTEGAVLLKQTEQKRPQGDIALMPPLTRLNREPGVTQIRTEERRHDTSLGSLFRSNLRQRGKRMHVFGIRPHSKERHDVQDFQG